MPAKKTKAVKSTGARKKTTQQDELDLSQYENAADVETTPITPPQNKPQFVKIAIVVLVLVAVAALVLRNRSWFLAATVNGTPIPRWELNNRLTKRYGNQMLEALIGERLITDAATKQGVQVAAEEIKAKIDEVEKSFGGQMSIDDALKLQGMTREEFENQVRVQLLIDKMLSKEVSVSGEEIDTYLKDNAALVSSDPAKRREEAEKAVKTNKIAEKFQSWFTQLKESAKVSKYL